MLLYVGLDVHKRFCYGTVMNEKGEVVRDGKFGKDLRCLEEFLDGVDEASVVMEAGYCWQPVFKWLERDGYDVKLAHPSKTRAIAEAKIKTDKIDSKILAHLLRADLVPESWVPPQEIGELRSLVKHRAFLVRTRTKLCSYAGLVPSVSRSGNKTVYGSITKEGSKWIRWALTQTVHVHVRYDSRLSRFYHRLAVKKGKQMAVVATARKMLKVVYWMLKEKEQFHP